MLCRIVSATIVTLVLSASGSAQQSQPAQPSPAALEWHRSQLPCGVRVIIVHAPQAKKQTTFSFLPANLANDDVDRAQWSHLLEHMLIRTTDAEGLNADGVTFNGETTDSYLRLETFADPAHWKDALERHARWLTATAFDAQRLEREKGMIAGEEQSTTASGMTGKFALAAWNQIFTFDRDRANVHGDVQQATVEHVAAYAKSHVSLDETVLIATIGPTPVE